jgi:hypothetical protein
MSLTFAAFANEHTPSTLTTPAASRMASDDEASDSEESGNNASTGISRSRHRQLFVSNSGAGLRRQNSSREQQQQQQMQMQMQMQRRREGIPACHPDGPQLAANEHILAFDPDMSDMLCAMDDDSVAGEADSFGLDAADAYDPQADGNFDLSAASSGGEPTTGRDDSAGREADEDEEDDEEAEFAGFDHVVSAPWFLGRTTLEAAETRLGRAPAGTFAVIEGAGRGSNSGTSATEGGIDEGGDDSVRLYTLLLRTRQGSIRRHLIRRFDVDEFQLRGHPQCFGTLEELACFAAEPDVAVPLQLNAPPHEEISTGKTRHGPGFAVPRISLIM